MAKRSRKKRVVTKPTPTKDPATPAPAAKITRHVENPMTRGPRKRRRMSAEQRRAVRERIRLRRARAVVAKAEAEASPMPRRPAPSDLFASLPVLNPEITRLAVVQAAIDVTRADPDDLDAPLAALRLAVTLMLAADAGAMAARRR